jgi:hypothetical protein
MYGITFLLLALAAACAGVITPLWPVRFVAWNAALAFALVAIAYLGAGTAILLKRADGTRSLLGWPLLWPYFLLCGFSFWLYRVTGREPAFAQVVPNLYLGRRLTPREVRQVTAIGWQAVLDLAVEFAEVRVLRRLSGYRSLPVLDATAPSWDQLLGAVDWLKEQVTRGPVLVHCALGHGRSATVVVAYLLAVRRVEGIKEGLVLLRSQGRNVDLHAA